MQRLQGLPPGLRMRRLRRMRRMRLLLLVGILPRLLEARASFTHVYLDTRRGLHRAGCMRITAGLVPAVRVLT